MKILAMIVPLLVFSLKSMATPPVYYQNGESSKVTPCESQGEGKSFHVFGSFSKLTKQLSHLTTSMKDKVNSLLLENDESEEEIEITEKDLSDPQSYARIQARLAEKIEFPIVLISTVQPSKDGLDDISNEYLSPAKVDQLISLEQIPIPIYKQILTDAHRSSLIVTRKGGKETLYQNLDDKKLESETASNLITINTFHKLNNEVLSSPKFIQIIPEIEKELEELKKIYREMPMVPELQSKRSEIAKQIKERKGLLARLAKADYIPKQVHKAMAACMAQTFDSVFFMTLTNEFKRFSFNPVISSKKLLRRMDFNPDDFSITIVVEALLGHDGKSDDVHLHALRKRKIYLATGKASPEEVIIQKVNTEILNKFEENSKPKTY